MAPERMAATVLSGELFRETPSVGYEMLLHDCMIGGTVRFQRADNVEAG